MMTMMLKVKDQSGVLSIRLGTLSSKMMKKIKSSSSKFGTNFMPK